MPASLDRDSVRQILESLDLPGLFIGVLGWDYGGAAIEAAVAGRNFVLDPIAHKRGLVAYQYVADSEDAFPDHPTRQKIERSVAKTVREHLVVYVTNDRNTQYWQWVKREAGRPDRIRTHIYTRGQQGEALIQKLEHLVFTLEEEESLTIVDASGRMRDAFDVERVTKRFYDRFKKSHDAFLNFIDGITNTADREWYASLMLNRMMFIYFIQKRGFLDNDPDYLRRRLERVRRQQGAGNFHSFYRLFLLRLFHEGLGQPAADRAPELAALLGKVPYLNGGLFDVHDLERDYPDIHIPDAAFERVFAFFDAYQWHLDDRPLRNDNEINPDVLGYIFEKYINQKQMGAYYTKEDITGYISRNTVVPFLFDRARKECAIAFKPGGGVWRLLSDDPDRYCQDALCHGITYDLHKKKVLAAHRVLPPEIAAGVNDVSKRGGWNDPASSEYALPNETWREHVARRQRYEEVRAKLADGDVTSINDLITYNLDVEKFAQDVIAGSEGPELVRAFWKALEAVSILDPTCGSGAFLFAALNILEPLYNACLDAMRGLLNDLDRSQRGHHPETLSDFRAVLEQIAGHASERYFILKSIIIGNLYGVDIMEEAVEICKLRLFLKLVAQLERYAQIEPLPDIDFNVRAGNSLVGFTSLDEVTRTLSSHLLKQLSLPQINESAMIAAGAFSEFRAMQTEGGMDADALAAKKSELRTRLDELRNELDEYLAGDYGVKVNGHSAFVRWRDSHQPFHWFVEFYGVMHGGGFDAIVGNPPYVEYKKARKFYEIFGFRSQRTANLYAYTAERCHQLLTGRGRLGLIIPTSFASSRLFEPLRDVFWDTQRPLWLSHFSNRPAQLFAGAQNRLTISISGETGSQLAFSTKYYRWDDKLGERAFLFDTLQYVALGTLVREFHGLFCKSGSAESLSILKKLDADSTIRRHLSQAGPSSIHWVRVPGYFCQFFLSPPMARPEHGGRAIVRGEVKTVHVAQKQARRPVHALLNSSTYYLFFDAYSDGRHINPVDVYEFPFDLEAFNEDVIVELERLSEQLQDAMTEHTSQWRKSGLLIDSVNSKLCKPIIDEIDRVLAQHYGLTDEELDFIINYHIKYRMGSEASRRGNDD